MKEVNIPNNIEAEESVIGSMLLTKKALQKALENLTSEDFYLDSHAKIFECIKNINDRKKPVDITTLSEELNGKGWLKQVGGVEYIADAINSVPTTANIDEYINIVLEKSLLRRLIDEATEIVKGSYTVSNDIGDYLYEAQKKINKVSEGLRTSEFKPIQSVLTKAQSDLETLAANKGDITGIPSGFYDLDKITSGFHPNELIIIAARPGMGKTAIALNMATNIAMNAKKSVAIFNMEMGAEQLVTRMLSQVGGIDGSKLRVGNLEHSDWKRVNEAISRLSDTKIFIDDTAGQTVADIRSKCRRLKNSPSGLDIVIIDYLTLIQSATKGGSTGQNRQQEVADISRALKTMAMELEIPVIALSQLSRGIEQRTDKKPMLSDLRESGAIEQDADLVAFLHCNDEEKEKDDSLMEFVIRKHRNGPLKDVPLLFRRNTSTFVNVANPNIEEEN